MCHYITAVLPPSAQIAALAGIFRRHGRALRPLENGSVQAQLLPGETYFLTTSGRCDCGTGLGASQRVGRSRQRRNLDGQMDQLRRKGWSETKVARWLQQHDEQQMAQSKSGDLSGGLDDWAALLKEAIASGHAPSLGLLLHSYGGPLAEPIRLKARKPLRAAEVTPAVLGGIDEDVLYEFTA